MRCYSMMKSSAALFSVPVLSKSALKVQTALSRYRLNLEVRELPSSTRSAKEAAESIGCSEGQIIKSLIFCTVREKTPILVLASGPNQVSMEKLSAYLGESVERPKANYVKNVTGFAIGGIPPVGHEPVALRTIIDPDLLTQEGLLWAAAGTPNAVFSLSPNDLLRITEGNGVQCDIKEDLYDIESSVKPGGP